MFDMCDTRLCDVCDVRDMRFSVGVICDSQHCFAMKQKPS